MGLFGKSGSEKEHKGGLKQVIEAAKPELNLSATQEQQIKELFKNLREERKDLKSAGGDNMREEIRAARRQAKQQLLNVLNDDQKRIFEKHLHELKNEADE